jgi:hypothetical protein
MSEQINSPNYIVCNCQHCDGHIEFDANQLTEESSVFPCPHCGLATKLFIPQKVTSPVGAESPVVRREGFFCGSTPPPENTPESEPVESGKAGLMKEILESSFEEQDELVAKLQEKGEQDMALNFEQARRYVLDSRIKLMNPETGERFTRETLEDFIRLKRLQKQKESDASEQTEELNRPPIRQKAISGRQRLRELEQVRNFLEEQDEASGFKSKTVVLNKAQCEMPIAQELIQLLVEIEKDGFVTEQGAQKLNAWLESNSNVEILAFRFLSEKVKRILSCGKLTTETEVGIEVALNLQIAIERVLPKQIREPILTKRRLVEEQLRNNMPASKEMVALIRQLGGKPPVGITRGEAYDLKEKLWNQPSDKQLSYIRGLGGNPSLDITREEAGEIIGSLLHSVSATEKQLEYIRSLGGNPRLGLSRAEAQELIPQLQTKQYQTSAQQQPPTQRQMMVLRFWNRTDLAQTSKWEVEQWLTKFYDEDSRRRKAWELFKAEAGDDGSQHDPLFAPLGAGENYLNKVN